jgi:hypothetical protein
MALGISELLYRHLIEAWWRSVNTQNTFLNFLNDTKNIYCNQNYNYMYLANIFLFLYLMNICMI